MCLCKDTSDEGLVSEVYEEQLKLNNKKTTWLKNGPKTLTDALMKKIHRWQISIWKGAPPYMSSGKCKFKQQWHTTIHLLGWPIPRTLIIPNTGEDVEQQELSFIAGGNAKWYSQDGLVVSYKSNILLPYDLAIMLPGICPKELRAHISTQKPAHRYL